MKSIRKGWVIQKGKKYWFASDWVNLCYATVFHYKPSLFDPRAHAVRVVETRETKEEK